MIATPATAPATAQAPSPRSKRLTAPSLGGHGAAHHGGLRSIAGDPPAGHDRLRGTDEDSSPVLFGRTGHRARDSPVWRESNPPRGCRSPRAVYGNRHRSRFRGRIHKVDRFGDAFTAQSGQSCPVARGGRAAQGGRRERTFGVPGRRYDNRPSGTYLGGEATGGCQFGQGEPPLAERPDRPPNPSSGAEAKIAVYGDDHAGSERIEHVHRAPTARAADRGEIPGVRGVRGARDADYSGVVRAFRQTLGGNGRPSGQGEWTGQGVGRAKRHRIL